MAITNLNICISMSGFTNLLLYSIIYLKDFNIQYIHWTVDHFSPSSLENYKVQI